MTVLARNMWGHGSMASAVAQVYSGGLRSRAPSGVQEQSPWSGVRGQSPPKAKALLVFGPSREAPNLPIFLKFGNAKNSDICVIFAKIIRSHETGRRGLEQNCVACVHRPWPKTVTDYF